MFVASNNHILAYIKHDSTIADIKGECNNLR